MHFFASYLLSFVRCFVTAKLEGKGREGERREAERRLALGSCSQKSCYSAGRTLIRLQC